MADESLRIDLAWMMRNGHAKTGARSAGTLHWTCRGEPSGSISYEADLMDDDSGRLILTYTRGSGEAREQVQQDIQLCTTKPHYGGRRWWMICPYTGRRAAKLYLPNGGDRFASRTAWRLGYYSQRAAPWDRPFDRLFRLQKQLGGRQGYGEFVFRPKGMWHRTFARHMERYAELDAACEVEWMAMVGRITAMAGH